MTIADLLPARPHVQWQHANFKQPAYKSLGRFFAIGYAEGVLPTLEIPIE